MVATPDVQSIGQDPLLLQAAWYRSLGPLGFFSVVMCLVPLLSFLEFLFRGENCILWTRDFLVEGFFNVGFLLVMYLFVAHFLLYFWLALWLIYSVFFATRNIIYRSFKSRTKRYRLRMWSINGLRFFGQVNLFVFVAIAACLWWALADIQPLAAALLGFLGLLLFLVFWRVRRGLARQIWAPLCLLAGILLAFLACGQFATAQELPAKQLSTEAAYDVLVLPNGETYATFVHSKAKQLVGSRWVNIRQTKTPQRLAYDSPTRTVFIVNKNVRPEEQAYISVLQQGRDWKVPIDTYLAHLPIISAAARKLFEISEGGRIHIVDIATLRLERTIHTGMLYGGAVDDRRGRLYITPDILAGPLLVMDIYSYQIVDRRWIGWFNNGAQVNEQTGEVWITRPLANAILVLDQHLRPVARIHVGFQPREMEIDLKHNVMYVGNFMGGTVTIMDLNTKKVVAHFRPQQTPSAVPLLDAVYSLLRGVFLDDQGALYLSERKGIFRIDAAEILALIHR